ncbi:hypothetical protein PQX77_000366 [Marasmius sp. AFHP31]|nr:hypothetical protein PQX77_000366 [Marasmius sp. AFHP31]
MASIDHIYSLEDYQECDSQTPGMLSCSSENEINYIDLTTLDSAPYSAVPVEAMVRTTLRDCALRADTAQKLIKDYSSSSLHDADSVPSTRGDSQPNEPIILDLDHFSSGDSPAFESLFKLRTYIQLPKATYPRTSPRLGESVTTANPSFSPTLPSLRRDVSLLEIAFSGSVFNDHHDAESDLGSFSISSISSRSSSPSSFATDIFFRL